uniref:PiggyBac transposable element-derived protein domain-containing protein n=1 Tax=Esox lucius TaxID=8010 RepID=A0A3P9AJZ6_ESOLU
MRGMGKMRWSLKSLLTPDSEKTGAVTESLRMKLEESDGHFGVKEEEMTVDIMQEQEEIGDWTTLDQILECEAEGGDSGSDSFLTDDEENYQDGIDPVEDVGDSSEEEEPGQPVSSAAAPRPLATTASPPRATATLLKRKRSVSPSLRSHPPQTHKRSQSAERLRSPLRPPKPAGPTAQWWKTEEDPDVAPIPPRFLPARTPGVQLDATMELSPVGLFKLFFSDLAVTTLCDNTNKMADRSIARGRKYKWVPVTPPELFKFIGVVLYMAVLKLPTINDYWRQRNAFSVQFPGTVMVRDRYRMISWNLHMSDPAEDVVNDRKKATSEYDALFRLRPLLDQIRTACKTSYHPHKNICIGERMFATRPRPGAKLTKCAFKVFSLSDSHNGYVSDFAVYTGRSRFPAGTGLSFDSVVQLIDPSFLGTGYNLFCDSFHTSPRLFRHLWSLKFGACGMFRKGLRDVPKSTVNTLSKRSPQGSLRWIREDHLLFVRWMDTREVSVCSSIHPAYSGETVKRKEKKVDGNRKEIHVPVPAPVTEYNRYMGGVDLSDPLTEHHKTKRWYRTVFFHLVDLAVANSYAMHKELCQAQQTDPMTYKMFIERLVAELCGTTGRTPPALRRSGHMPVPFSVPVDPARKATAGRQRCRKCRNDGIKNLSPWKCDECNVALCLIVDRNCFQLWHNM